MPLLGTVRQFPEISRSGYQETLYGTPLPANLRYLVVIGIAQDAVLSDVNNAVEMVLWASPNGDEANAQNKIIFREPWVGGLQFDKVSGLMVPRPLNVGFGPLTDYRTWRVKLGATFNQPIVMGARVDAFS